MPELRITRFRGGLAVAWNDAATGRRRRYQLQAATHQEAKAEALTIFRRETQKAAPRDMTVAEIWEAYRADLGPKTTAVTMGYTGKAVLGTFGAFTPDQIDRTMCRSYDAQRREQGISQGSIWTELGHLANALNWATKANLIKRAPHIWRPSKPEPNRRILNDREKLALVDAAEAPHIRLAIILLLGTAARIGAILDLEWERVDFERGTINLRTEGSETRKGRAVVPMSKMVRAALQTAHDAALSDSVVEYAGGPVKSIKTGFTAAVRRSRIGKVTIHEMRHTAAVTMVSAGVKMSVVSQMLGHSNLATTHKVYARYQPEHMADAAEVLDFMKLRKA